MDRTLPAGNAASSVPETSSGNGSFEDPTVHALDDGTLLTRWREDRDGDAFAELARRHSPVVYDITCRVLGDRAGAEDVLQEALLSLALEPTGKPAAVGVVAWLARFAICRAKNRRSSERCRARRQVVVGQERAEEAMPDDRLALSDEVEHALAGCEPDERALLAMRFLHGWDYDRIAAALSIQEGAARVRVHRALTNVRNRVKEGGGVAPALAALPLVPLGGGSLDATIRSVVELAKVKLGAPPNGVERATAATRSFRVAVTMTGAALLFVGAVGATVVPELTGAADRDAATAPSLDAALAARTARIAAGGVGASAADAAFVGVPRPDGWDRGAFRVLALGETVDGPVAPRRDAAARRDEAAAAPRADDRLAGAPRAADPVEPPDASRPTTRGACAAKGDSVSSDGERAGASGGSWTVVAAPPPAPPAVAADDAPRADDAEPAAAYVVRSSGAGGPRGARTEPPTAALADLPEETRAKVGEAADLVLRVLAADGAPIDPADAGLVRRRVLDLRRDFARLRRQSGADAPAGKGARGKRGASAAMRQVLTLLTQTALTGDGGAGGLRWPVGANVDAALAEVIRVLGAQTPPGAVPVGATVPAGAAP